MEYPVATMSASETLRQDAGARGTWDDVKDLPPSAKLVAKVLEYNDTMTQQEIAEETLLPARTVRYALNRLDEENVIDSRFSFSDARKRLYSLEIES
ncbi:winged helix-turn-helix transcriptional regulator [Natronobiforma cellulositropha]